MKRLLLIATALLFAVGARAQVAFVQAAQSGSSGSGSSTTVAPDSFDLGSGHAAFACVRQSTDDTPPLSVADGATPPNTFTQIGTTDISSGDAITIYYAKNTTAKSGDSVVATWLIAHIYRWIGIIEGSGIDTTSPLDASPTPNMDDASSDSITSNSFNTTTASELAFACIGINNTGQGFTAGSQDGGYTIPLISGTPLAAPDGDVSMEYNVFSSTKSMTTASMSDGFEGKGFAAATLAASGSPPPSGARLRGQVIQ